MDTNIDEAQLKVILAQTLKENKVLNSKLLSFANECNWIQNSQQNQLQGAETVPIELTRPDY